MELKFVYIHLRATELSQLVLSEQKSLSAES